MINDILKKHAEIRGDDVFIYVENEQINYKDFHKLVEKIADSFDLSKNPRRVKVSFKSKKLLLASIIALNRLKKIPVIFPERNKILKNVDYNKVGKIDCEINDNNCIIQQKYKNIKYYTYNKKDTQCCLFTTGSSSGVPKCVELTFENIFCSAVNWNRIYNFSKNDKYLNVLPLYHISGLSIFFRSLYNNFFTRYEDYNKNILYKILSENKMTCLSLVPKIFNDITSLPGTIEMMKKLKFIILGGDSIDSCIFKKCYDNNINLYSSYGLTESCSGISGFWIKKEKDYLKGFIGYPHFNTRIFIKDGFIAIKSKTIMKKYSSENKTNGIYITEDKAEMLGDKICFIGRKNHLIVSGGININLKNVENFLNERLSENEFAIVPFKDHKWGETFVVVYESDKKSFKLIKKIQFHCKNDLSDYMIPKFFINIKNIPRYSNLKINYSMLNQYVQENLK